MRNGRMHSGDVILCFIQFTDKFDIKKRPAIILYEEFGNYVVAGITSNTNMQGIPLLKKEGAIKDSIIKTNYIFTISKEMIVKKLFSASQEKIKEVQENISEKLQALTS
jgi:mRNA interferase MazF